MAKTRDDLIRQRAHQLWEAGGHGHGDHDDHWHRAEREIDEAGASETEDADRPSDVAPDGASAAPPPAKTSRSAGRR